MNMQRHLVSFFFVLATLFLGAQVVPPAKSGGSYQVTVLGDVHFDSLDFHTGEPTSSGRARERERNLAMWKEASRNLLTTAGNQTNDKSAFVIQLGDISQGDADTPELQEKLLKAAFSTVKRYFPSIPLVVVKGNHDVRLSHSQNDPIPYKNALLPKLAKELGAKKLEDGNYSFRKGGDLFIAVDGFVGAEKLKEFVQKTLDTHKNTRYVILLTHLPVLPVVTGNPFWRLPAADEIAAMLEKRNALILAAHTHTYSLVERKSPQGRLVQLVTTSMGNAWKPEPTLPVSMEWPQYLAAVTKAQQEKGPKQLNELKAILGKGDFSGQIFQQKSGFTVLNFSDNSIQIRIFTDNSGKPALLKKLKF